MHNYQQLSTYISSPKKTNLTITSSINITTTISLIILSFNNWSMSLVLYLSFFSYYQSPYYGHSPSARTSLSRYSTEESSNALQSTSTTTNTTTSSGGHYSKNRRISRDEDTSSVTGALTSNSSYYTSGHYGASRRASLSRASTLDDDDADSIHSNSNYEGVRSYYNSARKQFQQQQAALAAISARASNERFTSSSGGVSSSYFRNKLAKSRSSHSIGKYHKISELIY